MNTQLETFQKQKEYLVCVGSDGCVMDMMDVKHSKCFGPCMMEEWSLDQWKNEILQRWNEMNVYSMTRGINRFKALAAMLMEVDGKYTKIDHLDQLLVWTHETMALTDDSLFMEICKSGSPILKKALSWSEAVNYAIYHLLEEDKQMVSGAKEGLSAAKEKADIAVVSSDDQQYVAEEWRKCGLLTYTDVIAAPENGSKSQCIESLLRQGYERDQVLIVGDALGDANAAQENGVFFYPILAKKEKESWERFVDEALVNLTEGKYAGSYQKVLMEEFKSYLSRDLKAAGRMDS